jgi:hypothetical protein
MVGVRLQKGQPSVGETNAKIAACRIGLGLAEGGWIPGNGNPTGGKILTNNKLTLIK